MFEQFFNQPSHKLLCEAISKGVSPVTLIIGSGLSRPANLPDWRGLKRTLQLALDNDYTTKTAIDVNFSDPRYKRASTTEDYWMFFQISKDILGSATFNGIISNALNVHDQDVPDAYRRLLELNPRGVITLNLDALTGQVFSEHYTSQAVIPIYGFDIAKKWQIINDEKPYLVYLHGHISDPTTWILTQSDLKKLDESGGRNIFLSQVYLNNTVIFAGLSADDVAISSTLLRLKEAGFSPSRLFWATTRRDAASDAWAKENDVQKILYAAKDDAEHTAFFTSFVADIKKYTSQDLNKIPPKISGGPLDATAIKSRDPREIANFECEDVRNTLSDILFETLSEYDGDQLYDKFDEFIAKYRYPIQTKSFYKDGSPPDNVFFGHEIIFPPLGTGNFGEAFQAKSPEGEVVCLKIMHSNIVGNREMIGGFRRGIRSMEILKACG